MLLPALGQLLLGEHERPLLEARRPRRSEERHAADLDRLVLQVVPVEIAQRAGIRLADEVVVAGDADHGLGRRVGEPGCERRAEPAPLRLRASRRRSGRCRPRRAGRRRAARPGDTRAGRPGTRTASSRSSHSGRPWLIAELLEQRQLQPCRALEPRVERVPRGARRLGDHGGARVGEQPASPRASRPPRGRRGCGPPPGGPTSTSSMNAAWDGSVSSSVARPPSRIATRPSGVE